jgi:uncharacterized coiled-coil DUF342 family protein
MNDELDTLRRQVAAQQELYEAQQERDELRGKLYEAQQERDELRGRLDALRGSERLQDMTRRVSELTRERDEAIRTAGDLRQELADTSRVPTHGPTEREQLLVDALQSLLAAVGGER